MSQVTWVDVKISDEDRKMLEACIEESQAKCQRCTTSCGGNKVKPSTPAVFLT